MSDATERHVAAAAERVGRYRWLICGLLFAATAINYVDRQMIGILKPTLQADLGWSETDYANIVLWFQARSEEHTSELQSLMRISYAVFCLKKKKKTMCDRTYTHMTTQH